MTGQAYPSLSALISVGKISAGLDFTGGAIDQLLDDVRFTNLIAETSPDNDSRFYSLTLVTQELSIDLLGSGLKLIFFPAPVPDDQTNTQTTPPPDSEIPVQFGYRWPLLRHLPDFELLSFAHSTRAFLDLALALVDITEDQLVESVVTCFINDPTPDVALINAMKAWDSGSGATPLSGLDAANIPAGAIAIEYVVDEAIAQNVDLVGALCDTFIDDLTSPDQAINNLVRLAETWFGSITRRQLEALLLPQFSIALPTVSMAIEAPQTVLIELDANGQEIHSRNWRGTFTAGGVGYDSASGFDVALDQGATFNFPPAVIPGFGLTLAFHDIKVDLSRTTNIAEATADGRAPDFMGVWAGSAVIGLPPTWFGVNANQSVAIVGRNLLIGTGGMSGTIGLEVLGGDLKPPATATPASGTQELTLVLGRDEGASDRKGFAIGFSKFDMTFRQNVLLSSRIVGSLTVPRLSAGKIGIELYLTRDGDFDLTATLPAGGHDFTVPNVFTFKAKTISLGKTDNRVFLRTSGELSFEGLLGGLITKPIHIEKLLIDASGGISLEGGSIPLQQSVVIPLGPAKIAITAIHFGKTTQPHNGTPREYAYWGFDGGVDVSPGGINCKGDGIKFYYTIDDDPGAGLDHHQFLRIEGIGIDLVIPFGTPKEQAVVLIRGYLAIKGDLYQGKIDFILPKAKIAGGAAMQYHTKHPAWLVQAWLELPQALPLGSTSLGIFGFSGLFGMRFIADKVAAGLTEDATWGDFYRAPQMGVSDQKFATPETTGGASNPFSIGAGVSLATIADGGQVFTSQLFLMIQTPLMILLDGKFDVLADERLGLTGGDPPFYAFIILTEESVQIGAGAHYLIPRETGEILTLNATLDSAYFFHNASAWYVNVGTKASPVTAEVIKLFHAYAYLMLSANGIEAGTGVTYDFNKSYGPVSIAAHAYLDLWGYASFVRGRVGGGIALGGYVDIRAFKVGLQISLATALTLELAKPFRIAGSVEACISVDLKFKTFSKCVDVDFVWERSQEVDLEGVPLLTGDVGKPPAAAVHMVSRDTYPVEFSTSPTPSIDCYVPVDSWIDIKLSKPVTPGAGTAKIAGYTNGPVGASERLPPQYAARAVDHAYSLESIVLEVRRPDGTWTEYHPYQSLAGEASVGTSQIPDLSDLPIGAWQKQDPGFGQLRLLAVTPFSFMQPGLSYQPEEWGVTPRSLYCVSLPHEERCAIWTQPSAYSPGAGGAVGGMTFLVEGAPAAVTPLSDPRLGPTSLGLKPGARLAMTFHEPVVSCRIVAWTEAPQVTVRFQRRKVTVLQTQPAPITIDWPTPYPEYEDQEVRSLPRAALANPVVYNNPAAPIERVIIETMVPDHELIASLQNQLETLYDQLLMGASRPAVEAEMAVVRGNLAAEHARTCVGDDDGANSGAGDGPTGGTGSADPKAELDALTRQLTALERQLAAQQAHYDRYCPTKPDDPKPEDPKPDDPKPDDSKPDDPKADDLNGRDGCLGPIIRPIAGLFGRPRRKVMPSPPPPPPPQPPPPAVDCDALAAAIVDLTRQIEELQAQIAALESGSSDDGGQQGEGFTPPKDWACATFVHEVCWLTSGDHAFNQAIPGIDAIEADYTGMRAAVNHNIAPVWRPEQTYRVTLNVRDTVSPPSGSAIHRDSTFYVHFKTDGPLGFYSEYVPPALFDQVDDPNTPPPDDRDEAPEVSLKAYVDPRSYPDPTGDLSGAKPLYFADVSLELYLSRPHAYHFFADWPDPYGLGSRHYAMELRVLDPAMIKPAPGALPHEAPDVTAPKIGVQTWFETVSPQMTPEIATINNYSLPAVGPEGGVACLSIGGDPIKPAAKAIRTALGDLQPDKLYTAVVINRRLYAPFGEAEVYRFPFQTSLYADFAAHIASCQLKDAAGNVGVAAFTIDHAMPAGARPGALTLVQSGASPADAEAYPDPFDRLIYARLKLDKPAPPAGLEFNFLTDTVTGETYGLWIRGREPINSPRLDAATAQAAIELRQASVAVGGVDVLVSRDRCEAFLMAESGPLPLSDLTLAFGLWAWNGVAYALAETAVTPAFGKS